MMVPFVFTQKPRPAFLFTVKFTGVQERGFCFFDTPANFTGESILLFFNNVKGVLSKNNNFLENSFFWVRIVGMENTAEWQDKIVSELKEQRKILENVERRLRYNAFFLPGEVEAMPIPEILRSVKLEEGDVSDCPLELIRTRLENLE